MSEENRQKPWFKLTCLGCFIVPCLLGLGTFGYIKYRINQKADQLPVELAKIKAMGLPTTSEELNARVPVSQGQNAATVYRELIAEYESLKKEKEPKEVLNLLVGEVAKEPIPHANQLLKDALARRAKIFTLVTQASKIPNCNFERDWTKGAALLFPEFASIKEVAKWLATRAKLQVRQGDKAGAIESVNDIFSLAHHMGQDPTMIGALVSIAIDAIGVAALEAVTETERNDATYLAMARQMMERLPPLPIMKDAFAGELVGGRYTIASIRSARDLGFFEEGFEPMRHIPFSDPAVRKMFEASFVRAWREVLTLLPEDPDEWKKASEDMDKFGQKLDADKSIENTLNRIMFPVFSNAFQARAIALARRRVASVSLRLLQDRLHALPKTITQYGPIAIDPMDGKPLRFKADGRGFRVWSIDRDLVDNGGVRYKRGTGAYRDVDYVWGFDTVIPEAKPPTGPTGGPPPAISIGAESR